MKITLNKKIKTPYDLTIGKTYNVIGIESDNYRIMNDYNKPYLYDPSLFEVIDNSPQKDWIVNYGEEGEKYAYSKELNESGFFEDLFDHVKDKIKIFEDYYERVYKIKIDHSIKEKIFDVSGKQYPPST